MTALSYFNSIGCRTNTPVIQQQMHDWAGKKRGFQLQCEADEAAGEDKYAARQPGAHRLQRPLNSKRQQRNNNPAHMWIYFQQPTTITEAAHTLRSVSPERSSDPCKGLLLQRVSVQHPDQLDFSQAGVELTWIHPSDRCLTSALNIC